LDIVATSQFVGARQLRGIERRDEILMMPAKRALGSQADLRIEMPERLAVADDLLAQTADENSLIRKLTNSVEVDLVARQRPFDGNRQHAPIRRACSVDH